MNEYQFHKISAISCNLLFQGESIKSFLRIRHFVTVMFYKPNQGNRINIWKI